MLEKLRVKLQKIVDEANAKAANMSEEELNNRLGPATRGLFAATEQIDASAKKAMVNAQISFFFTITFIVAGFYIGKALLAQNYPVMGGVAFFLLLGTVSYILVARIRQKDIDVGYLSGFLGMIAASAGGNGDMIVLLACFGMPMGAGLAALQTKLPGHTKSLFEHL